MQFYIHTFGCRVNAAESVQLGTDLLQAGFQVSSVEQADILIINSCAVTQKAVREIRQFIYQAKKKQPKQIVAVTGCAATLWQKQQTKLKQIDLIVTNQEKAQLAKLLKKQFLISPAQRKICNLKELGKFINSGRLIIKVQDGCDYFCTYCIVPYLRGRSKSVVPSKIVNYINKTSQATQVNEVILSGINLGLYGKGQNYTFVDLIKAVLKDTKVARISYGSLYVENLTQAFFKLYQSKDAKRLARFFHVPLQSGSPKILKLMQRRYILAEFSKRVEALKKAVPDSLLATDIIVGFLGESDEDFSQTYNFLKPSPFTKAHIFRYSEREQTAAKLMKKKYSEPKSSLKQQRALKLKELFAKKLLDYQKNLVGKREQALIIKKLDKQTYKGFLNNNLEVIIKTRQKLAIEPVNVKIVELKNRELVAQLDP